MPDLQHRLRTHDLGFLKIVAEEVITIEEAETLLGENIQIRIEDGNVFINDSQVIITDIVADNGVIHVIDAVLLPPEG